MLVGGPRLLADLGVEPAGDLATAMDGWAADGRTVLAVVADGRLAGALAVEDEIRPESAAAVAALHEAGLRVAMITGDAQAVADSVARRLGIDEVAAQVLPADKADAVRRFQAGGRQGGDGRRRGERRAGAGDRGRGDRDRRRHGRRGGVRRDRPRAQRPARRGRRHRAVAGRRYRKMVQNLVWATGYNLVAIPVAMGVLVPWGIDLPMAAGAVAMSLSTIIVAANAQLLRRVELHRGDGR